MQRAFVYIGGAGFSTGVVLASLYPNTSFDIQFITLLAAALVVVALRKPSARFGLNPILVSFFLGALVLGLWRTELYEREVSSAPLPVGETVTFAGVVVREPDERANSTHLYVSDGERLVLVTTERYQAVAYGDRLEAAGKVTVPKSFETDLGRTFNYPGYLKAKGVTQTMSYADIEVVAEGEGSRVIGNLLALKSLFLQRIEQLLPEPQAGLSEGLLLGVKRALGDELEQIFRSTGIIHIVVLSGYNIMLVVAFTLYLLSFVVPWRGRLVVGMAAIAAFALMVGLSATVLRASIMAALALTARSFGRTYDVIHGLVLAGLGMLMINPYLLVYDTGFQLSFMATLGLIVVAPYLESPLKRVPAVIGIREFLMATLATQLFVLPILLYQIGEFSVVSVAVNVLVLPMVPVAMLATFLMVVMSLIALPLAVPFTLIAYVALTYILTIPSYFAALPFASFVVPAFPFWLVVCAYAGIAWGLYRWQQPSDPLAHWTIEEEAAVLARLQSSDKTPVFFR